MNDSKKDQVRSSLFYILGVLCWLGALINILRGEFTYVVVIQMGLGATCIGLGSNYSKKSKENDGEHK